MRCLEGTVESGPRESNPVSLGPEPSGLPSSSNPVEKAGIEPARRRLQGATAALAVIPVVELARFERAALSMPSRRSTRLSYSPTAAVTSTRRTRRQARRGLPEDAHAMDMSTGKPVLRGSQGPQESNPHYARVGAGPPNRWLIPMQMKTARWGFPRGRFPVSDLPVSSGNLPNAQGRLRGRVIAPVAFGRSPEHHESIVKPGKRGRQRI